MFLADNIGNNTSITSIGNTLVNEKLIDTDKRNGKPAVQTIQSYVGALLVTESMNEPSFRERELAPLQKIRDNYAKTVIAGECNNPVTQHGIKIVRLTDFLLES